MNLKGLLFLLIVMIIVGFSGILNAQTTFKFGGFVKLDMMSTNFNNGPVAVGSPLRDFHFPAAIPVGGSNDVFSSIDYHAKESRFNFASTKN